MELSKKENTCDEIYLLILFIIIIILYFDYLYFSNCNLDTLEMTEQDKDDIFKYLEYFINLLNKNNIIYWIIGGTTLGAVRHNDIVPWDDDADIGIFEDDMHKLLALKEELAEDGFEIIYYWKIFKFRKINQEYPFIDIFLYKKSEDKYIMHRDDLISVWPNEYYLEEELFPLKQYKFGNLLLNGPNYPLDYLDRMYPNWRFVGKHIFDHKENKKTNITIELDQNNPEHKLKPILYINSEKNTKKIYDETYNEKIVTIE